MEDEPEATLIGVVDHNKTQDIRVRAVQWHGRDYLDLRVFYTHDASGDRKPSRKGISIPVHHVAEVHAFVDEGARRRGVVMTGPDALECVFRFKITAAMIDAGYKELSRWPITGPTEEDMRAAVAAVFMAMWEARTIDARWIEVAHGLADLGKQIDGIRDRVAGSGQP